MPRPPTGETPGRHIRIPDDIWGDIGRIAREEGRSVTSIVIEALKRWLAWHKRKRREHES